MDASARLTADREWMRAAPCYGQTALFYAEERWLKQQAREICNDCILKHPCREYARKTREKYGIWGGEDEVQREKEIRRMQRWERQRRGA